MDLAIPGLVVWSVCYPLLSWMRWIHCQCSGILQSLAVILIPLVPAKDTNEVSQDMLFPVDLPGDDVCIIIYVNLYVCFMP